MADITTTADSTTPIMADKSSGDGSGTVPSSSSSLIVTSGASRSEYGNNMSTINAATQNLKMPTTISQSTDANGNISKYMSDGTRVTTDSTGNKITPQTPVNVLGNSQTGAKVTGSTAETDGSMTVKYDDGTSARFTQNPDGTYKQDTSNAGSSTVDQNNGGTNADGTPSEPKMNSSLDPSIMSAYKDSLGNLDKGIQSAKDALTQAQATLSNDPAAASAVSAIMAKYDTQIQLMKDKNAMLLGSYRNNAARNGSMQYANDMYTNFMSEEQDRATGRITDLITQETQMVLKAQQAAKTGDIKAVAEATKAYEDANKAKIDEINKLLVATNNHTKTLQTQAKIDQATQNSQITNDIKNANINGKGIADEIKAAGLTGQDRLDYIAKRAKDLNITDPTKLESTVGASEKANSKADLSAANIKSTIAKRNQGKTSTSKTSNPITFKPLEKNALAGAGLDGASITELTKAINLYGVQAVYADPKGLLSDGAKKVLESKFGITPTKAPASKVTPPANNAGGGNI